MSAEKREMRSGFTIVELLVAVAIMAIVTVYLLDSFTVNQKAYIVVDQLAEAQQNNRAVADLIERDIRHAGLMVPAGGAICGVDEINNPDVLYLSDAGVIDPTSSTTTTNGSTFSGNNVTSGLQNITVSSLLLDGNANYDTDGNGTNDSDFQEDGGVIVMDRNNPDRGTACGRVELVTIGTNTIRIDIASGALGPLAGLADLIAIPAHEYRVNGLQLERNGMVLAQGVEDLQFAVFVDANTNNLVDPNEYRGDGIGGDYVANAIDHEDSREVRVNIVMRTRMQDRDYAEGQFQDKENRLAVAGNDGFRRRTHTSTALLRNVMSRMSL